MEFSEMEFIGDNLFSWRLREEMRSNQFKMLKKEGREAQGRPGVKNAEGQKEGLSESPTKKGFAGAKRADPRKKRTRLAIQAGQ